MTVGPLAVSSKRLAPLFLQARADNIDVDALLSELDLPGGIASPDGDGAISLGDYYRIQNRLMLLMGDETAHLSSRQLLPGSTDFVLRNIAGCTTLFEVMGVIAKTYNLLHGGEYNAVYKRRHSIDYVIDDRLFPFTHGHEPEDVLFSTECLLIFLHCMLMTVTPRADCAVRALQVRRASPGGDCGHLGYWEAPMKFGAEKYVVSFARDEAEAVIAMPPEEARSSNAVYRKILATVAGMHARREKRQSIAARVRDSVERGVLDQSAIADQLGLSVATLRRRLATENTGFRQLRREALNERAKRLLASGADVADVSERLGFSEFRAFNRAFKEWNGLTPRAYLRENQS